MSSHPFRYHDMRNTFITTKANTYSYIHVEAEDKPTLVLLHGFPSHIEDWINQIEYFGAEGYGLVALDLLGYGESSTPENVHLYRLRSMSDEIIELLDHLRLEKVVGVGHDFGATLLSRLAAYHPERWLALVLLAVGPPKLGTPFDVKSINQMTKAALGHELLGYIPWLGGDEDASAVLEKHPEALMSLMFAADEAIWNEWFRPLGKMKEFVAEDRRVAIGDWYLADLRQEHLLAFARPSGYKGSTKWYKMWLDNLFAPDEEGFEDYRFEGPTLFIVPSSDNGQQEGMLAEWARDLKVVSLDCGHWVHIERRHETNDAIEAFVTKILQA